MHEIARKIELTDTEASRQLIRMSKAGFIERCNNNAYTLTQIGRLLLVLSSSMEFVRRNKPYFIHRDFGQIPVSFVYRFGELSQGVLLTEQNEIMIRWEEIVEAADEYLCVMMPQVMPFLSRKAVEGLRKGVNLRSINNRELSQTSIKFKQTGENVERRFLPRVSAGVVSSEKEASFFIYDADGGMDTSAFFGNDASFMDWVNDLFLHYWDNATS